MGFKQGDKAIMFAFQNNDSGSTVLNSLEEDKQWTKKVREPKFQQFTHKIFKYWNSVLTGEKTDVSDI